MQKPLAEVSTNRNFTPLIARFYYQNYYHNIKRERKKGNMINKLPLLYILVYLRIS